eukprot:4761964-Prymnesium_polylepis.1
MPPPPAALRRPPSASAHRSCSCGPPLVWAFARARVLSARSERAVGAHRWLATQREAVPWLGSH